MVPRASKVDNKSPTIARGKPKFDQGWVAIGKVYCLSFPRFLVSRSSYAFYRIRSISLPELSFFLIFFFASVASPPLLVLERDNVPNCDSESFFLYLCVFVWWFQEKKVEMKTGGFKNERGDFVGSGNLILGYIVTNEEAHRVRVRVYCCFFCCCCLLHWLYVCVRTYIHICISLYIDI